MSYKPNHLSPALVERLDRELTEAIHRVETGQAAKAAVSLAFAVELDDDAKLCVSFVHKSGSAKKGSFHPATQARLPLEELAAE